MQKIFVVEDDWTLNRAVCYALKKNGYEAMPAHSLSEGRKLFGENSYSLVVLDVNLPDGEGFALCEWMKAQKDIPVIFLTARDLEEDALLGYEMGAEDYVTKPFSMNILLKKVEIILRRTQIPAGECFDDGYLKVDLENAKVTAGGVECQVTPTEFRLLRMFLKNQGQLLTYEILLDRLWDSGGQFVDKHALAVNVNRLRGKLEDEQHKYISNVYGMGYQWVG